MNLYKQKPTYLYVGFLYISVMCNCNCITVKDFLKCIWIEEVSCNSKVCEFNSILRKFYLDVYDVDHNRVTEPFIWSGPMEIMTDYPIHKLVWIFWKEDCTSCWCNACMLDVPTCSTWCSCEYPTKQVMHQKWDLADLREWEYRLKYKWICVNIPSCLNEWRIVYYRWPDVINSIDEKLCLPDDMLVALEYITMHDYAIKSKQFDAAQFYSSMYQQVIKKMKDKEATVPFAVWKWNSVYQTNSHTTWI